MGYDRRYYTVPYGPYYIWELPRGYCALLQIALIMKINGSWITALGAQRS